MTKTKVSQQKINEICIEIEKQGEDISIEKVKKILGQGVHSDIAPKVLLFKEDKNAALLSTGQVSNAPSKIEKNKIDEDNLLHHLSIEIKKILEKYSGKEIDKTVLEVREIVEKYIKNKIRQTPNIYYQNTIPHQEEDLKEHIEHLEKQNQALISKYKSLEQKIRFLEHDKKLILNKSSNDRSENQQNSSNEIIEESISEQIKQLKGDRRAAFSENKISIYLYTTDFSTTLIKELKKGKQGRHQANTIFNYKTKLWELTKFNLTTIQFLFTNGFDISEHLIQYAQKLKRQQTLQGNK